MFSRVLLLFILFPSSIFAQIATPLTVQDNNLNLQNIASEKLQSVIIEFDLPPKALFSESAMSIREQLGESAPISVQSEPSVSMYHDRGTQLNDMITSMRRGSSSGVLLNSDVYHDTNTMFYRTFHGMRASLDSLEINKIRSLPFVKAVYPDAVVEIQSYDSVSQIGADSVWSMYGNTGAGIRIGIIDSGVDYMHPALGGGFGAGFKVIDGWDFVDNDLDPMDEHRHGTHVAGIAAGHFTAQGSTQQPFFGVAPDAKIIAYRVLDHEGRGRMSDIIAAIERSVDPDQNGDFSDRLDVINLSLGSKTGTPDDPVSTAANNAFMAGVVVVVAAGNNGYMISGATHESLYMENGSQTIGSPAAAKYAITVGAIDRSKNLAPFSSKGPVNASFGLKPDVVAPGVDIISSIPGGSYTGMSGTSMAAPHVAGLAALLRSQNPDWNAAQIKAALTQSAENLGIPVTHQGNGLIQSMSSFRSESFRFPNELSFGMVDVSNASTVLTQDVLLCNRFDVGQYYNIESGVLPSGVAITVHTNNVFIQSNRCETIRVTFTINVNILGIVTEDIRTYGGILSISTDREDLNLPWSFSIAPTIRIHFSSTKADFVISSLTQYIHSHQSDKFNQFHWKSDRIAEIYAASSDLFTSVASFVKQNDPTHIILNENQAFNGKYAEYVIDHQDAVHEVWLPEIGYFQNISTQISELTGRVTLVTGNGLITRSVQSLSTSGLPAFKFSHISASTTLHFAQKALGVGNVPTLMIPRFQVQHGINRSLHISDSQQLFQIPLRFNITGNSVLADAIATTHPSIHIIALTGFYSDEGEYDFLHSEEISLLEAQVDDSGFAAVNYYTSENSMSGIFTATRFLIAQQIDEGFYRVFMETNPISVWGQHVITDLPSLRDITPVEYGIGETIVYGNGPLFSFVRPNFNVFGPGSINFAPIIRGPLHEIRMMDYPASTFAVRDQVGRTVYSGSLDQIPRDMTVPVGATELEINVTGHVLRGKQSITKIIGHADLNRTFATPPWIYSVLITDDNGIPVESVENGNSVNLMFAAKSIQLLQEKNVNPALTEIQWRKHGDDGTWSHVDFTYSNAVFSEAESGVDPYKTGNRDPHLVSNSTHLRRDGTRFYAPIDGTLLPDSSAIDIQFKVVDESGNYTTTVISPAFVVGNWQYEIPTGIEQPQSDNPDTFELLQNYPNPFNPTTTIRYSIPDRHSGEHVLITVHNIIGQEVSKLIDSKSVSGTFEVNFSAHHLSSGVYIVTMTAGQFRQSKKMMLMK